MWMVTCDRSRSEYNKGTGYHIYRSRLGEYYISYLSRDKKRPICRGQEEIEDEYILTAHDTAEDD